MLTEPAVELVLDACTPLHLEDATPHGRDGDHGLEDRRHDQDAQVADEVPPQLARAPHHRVVHVRRRQEGDQRPQPETGSIQR